ncbi:MAG TPA: DUF5067 domain-containing protein [Candidatus Levilactobacillus faecigallinarum]|uniref:DUF5067 domain-containing protein n=1 Tax=Candidatus Levilactobacillus faecigallinarum TaxID=2838638 RepID=A0A9D1U6P3_9LACO|nr:DUF5067 domain-containing protein [Candidatus Levilactobacillus faecigallinarum]
MKHRFITTLVLTGMVFGSLIPATSVSAKKHSLKNQHLSGLKFSNSQLKGNGTKGAKISVYHGSKKLGSAKIKRSSFTFKWSKLRTVKNNWHLTVVSRKNGYKLKKASVTAKAFKSNKTAINSKVTTPKSEYLNGTTFVTKEGTLTLHSSVRESDGMDGENILIFLTYTNTTKKSQDLSSIVYYDLVPKQNLGSVTKELEISSVDEDSAYYNKAQVIDSEETVNPGATVSTVAAWTLSKRSAPVKVTLQTPQRVRSFGTITFN